MNEENIPVDGCTVDGKALLSPEYMYSEENALTRSERAKNERRHEKLMNRLAGKLDYNKNGKFKVN